MGEPDSHHLGGLDIDLARRIDAVCRRFEADWRVGGRPRLEDYLAEIPEEGRVALRAELEALEHELGHAGATISRSEPGPIAEAPTLALADSPTFPVPGLTDSRVHEQATVAPRDDVTVDLGSAEPGPRDDSGPARVRYFGDYEIEGELARGGMGVVFRARQRSLNRPVALKMILAGQLADAAAIRRFHIEAEAAANLDHPGIVPIYEVGEHEGQHYFSMGYVEGQSLAGRLAQGPLPCREAARLIVGVCEAVDYAHRRGVIHRDLKPANILLDQRGSPRVTDFGLARMVQGDSGLTGSGQIMGTPSYMPPEQASGRRGEVGPAADVYALGATLYALVIGRPPFQAATATDTVIQVLSDEPVPPRRLNAAVDRDVETICLKCLQKEPGKRYPTAAALREDLRRYLAGEPIQARPVGPAERAWRWCRRNPALAGLAAGIALALVLGTAVASYFAVRATRGERAAINNANEARDNLALANQEKARANLEAERASQAAQKALDEARRADAEARRVREEKWLSDHRLYAAEISLAQEAWRDGKINLVRQHLDSQAPGRPGNQDLRGFEWYYLDRLLARDLRTLRPHPGAAPGSPYGVVDVAYSPDGRTLASAGTDRLVRLWDLAAGTELGVLRGHRDAVRRVAYSPDGRTVASASHDGTIKLWDAATDAELRTWRGHEGRVDGLAFSPDGRTLATSGDDFTARLWDTATGKERHVLRAPGERWVYGVAFSPDGRTLATAGWDRTVKLWDAGTGRAIRAFPAGRTLRVLAVACSPDGRTLASAAEEIKLWDAATGREIRSLPEPTTAIAFGPDGRTLASAHELRGALTVWDVATGRKVRTVHGHTRGIPGLAYSPDGRTVATASRDDTIKLWDDGASQESRPLRGRWGRVHAVAYSPDGRTLACAGYDGTVKLWDTTAGQEIRTLFGHLDRVYAVAYSPDGSTVASAGVDRTIRLWDAATGRETRTLLGHVDGVLCVAFRPDGRTLASAGADGLVKLWDMATGREVRTLSGHADARFNGWPKRTRSSPDYRGSKLRNLMSSKQENVPAGSVNAVAYSPDGHILASAGVDGTVRLWDGSVGREIRTLTAHQTPETFESGALSVAFASDGRTLATGGNGDHLVKIWDAATGAELRALSGHEGGIWGLSFSPDGRRLASAGTDGAVKLWEIAATGREVLTLRGESGETAMGVAFSPDGHALASAGMNVTVSLWDAAPMTPEWRAVREARGVVEFLFARQLPAAEVADRIRHDRSIGHDVRRHALRLAEDRARARADDEAQERTMHQAQVLVHSLLAQHLPAAEVAGRIRRDPAIGEDVRRRALEVAEAGERDRVHAEADQLVAGLFARLWLREDVEESLRADRTLSEPVRAQALAMARWYSGEFLQLANATWDVVRRPDAGADAYRGALRWVEGSRRINTDPAWHIGTLGVAQYRTGHYREAVATLTQADRLQSSKAGGSNTLELAFLALSHHRLGESEQARTALGRLREAMKQPRWASDPSARAILHEAEAIELDRIFPAEPFARP
jgi:WD40 repeat protein